MDAFLQAYIECALWAETDSGGNPLDDNYGPDDLAPETLQSMKKDCDDFQAANKTDLEQAGSVEYNGHDFWLTRNRHGAGFWDRGYGEIGERLTEAAHVCGSTYLYVGDDGKLYVS